MPATYSDVLLAKLALEYRQVSPEALRECLDAQEAAHRAGVISSLGQVLIRRGYLTHEALRRLEYWTGVAERSRRANLEIQLLQRHGRPEPAVLRAYYERLQQGGFTEDLGWLLESAGYLRPEERRALDAAVQQAWYGLFHREAEELRQRLAVAAAGGWWGGGALPAAPPGGAWAAGALGGAGAYAVPAADPSGLFRAALQGAHQALPAGTAMFRAVQPEQFDATGGSYAPAGLPAGPAAPPGGVAYPAPYQQTSPWDARTAQRQAHPELWPAHGGWPAAGPGPGPQAGAGQPAAAAALPARAAPGARRPARVQPLVEPSVDIPGYERLERLGRGRLGVLFRARRLSDGTEVALRVFFRSCSESAELVEQFYRELEVLRSLRHPNILRTEDGGEANGHLYLVFELLDAQSVQDLINLHGRVREAECLRWAAQVARAMDHYARRGLVHGDLRPQSILLTRTRRAVLCELGIDVRPYEEHLRSRHGVVRSSPAYLAPEQGMGAESFDVRADIYALGITMFHALTGRVPFDGPNPAVVISRHARDPLPDPRDFVPAVSAETVELLRKMCAKRPEDRHRTARELLAEIAWVHSEKAGGSTPIVPLEPPDVLGSGERSGPRSPSGLWRRVLRAFGFRR